MFRFILCILLVAGGAVLRAAETKSTAPAPGGYTEVQLVRGRSNHLLMDGLIQGKKETFLVDSGAETSVLDSEEAKNLGLKAPEPATGIPVAVGGMDVVWAPQLVAGAMNFGAGPFATVDFSERQEVFKGSTRFVKGIVGWDILHHYRAILNCHTMQIFFKTNPAASIDLSRALEKSGYRTAKLRVMNEKILAPVQIQGKPFEVIVDTGSFLTTLLKSRVDSLHIENTFTTMRGHGMSLGINEFFLAQPAAHQMSVGGLPVNLAIGVSQIPMIQETGGATTIGLLGGDVLAMFDAIIDFDKLALYLKPVAGR